MQLVDVKSASVFVKVNDRILIFPKDEFREVVKRFIEKDEEIQKWIEDEIFNSDVWRDWCIENPIEWR